MRSTKLTYLMMMNFDLGGNCLLDLPCTIQEMDIQECSISNFKGLAEALPHLTNLVKLCIRFEDEWAYMVVEAVTEHCTQLKELGLSGGKTVCPNQILITDLVDLEVLYLSLRIDDDFLLDLSRKCKDLIELYIDTDNITFAGIAALAALPKLGTLEINQRQYRESLAGAWREYTPSEIQKLSRLNGFPSLKDLVFSGCYSLNPSETYCLMESSPLLEQVGLYAYETRHQDIICWWITRTVTRNSKVRFDLWQSLSKYDKRRLSLFEIR